MLKTAFVIILNEMFMFTLWIIVMRNLVLITSWIFSERGKFLFLWFVDVHFTPSTWRDKTVLSTRQLCLVSIQFRRVRVGGVNTIWDATKQFCLVSNIVFTPPTRQFCPVSTQFRWVLSCRVGGLNTIGDATKLSSCRVGGVNKPLQFYSVKDGSIYQWRVKIHWSICLLSTQKSTTSFA